MKIRVITDFYDILVNQKTLKVIPDNIEFFKELREVLSVDLVVSNSSDQIKIELQKYKLSDLFENIIPIRDISEIKNLFSKYGKKYDLILYFNNYYKESFMEDNIIYLPIDLNSELDRYINFSFVGHAKNKLLYNELSEYYNIAIDKDTEQEVEFLNNIFLDHYGKTEKVLDCCCGIGRHSALLAKKGYQVTGIDVSQNQIKNANRFNSHMKINYINGDVRDFALPEHDYDCAICMWTSYNYFSTDSDIRGFIKSAYEHLKNKGLLVLDSKNFFPLKKFRTYIRTTEDKNIELSLIIFKKIINNIQNGHYLYLLRDKKCNNYSFFKDEEIAKIYSIKDLESICRGYFSIEAVYGDFNKENYYEESSDRLIIVLSKESR
ncbi:class I SAM-dependent methyltransferase [Acetivibrio cellulolyticus]|uniref:class I SAM-dependent methyltransferase n=1 Tax=Acetivibrio cellulolyticus TaxID=35830 RepID=UPI0001E2D4D2|nr:class I SAM-dependent methyltransferase [Acetivibrio cellulolyticus]